MIRDGIVYKTCKKCGVEKPLDEFELDSRKKDGHTGRCRECAREYKRLDAAKHHDRRLDELRKWREEHPEEYKEQKHAEYIKHRETYQKQGKQWYQDNKEHVAEQGKIYRTENKDKKYKTDRAYRARNIDRVREYFRVREKCKRETDPEYQILCRLRRRLWGALKEASKTDRTTNLLGCNIEFLRERLESLFTEGMSWECFMAGGIHIDHIRPCASFDLTDPVQQRICFNYRNLQPLWARDNLVKRNKWDSSDMSIWANRATEDLLVEIQHIKLTA